MAFINTGWSDEQVEVLKVQWVEGLSASQIGRLVGKTRNAVLGKAHRLIHIGQLSARAEALQSRPKVPRVYVPKADKPLPLPPVEAKPALLLEDGTNVTVMTISDRMCRWPIGDPAQADFHFCGHAPDKGVYCEAHARIAYVPGKPYVPREHRSKHQHI